MVPRGLFLTPFNIAWCVTIVLGCLGMRHRCVLEASWRKFLGSSEGREFGCRESLGFEELWRQSCYWYVEMIPVAAYLIRDVKSTIFRFLSLRKVVC